MKLSLKMGLPLLLVLLVGIVQTDGVVRLALELVAIGIALWTAFSLPQPSPRDERPREGAPPAWLAPGPGDAPDGPGAAQPDGRDEAPPPDGGRPGDR